MSALTDLGFAVDAAVSRINADKATLAQDEGIISDLHNQLTAAQANVTDEAELVALKDKLNAATSA